MRAGAMVCFCDLPLSLIGKHREEYGKFAIGLRKDWGLKNGVAPVIYTHSKAQTRPPVLRLTVKAPASHDKTLANDDLDILAAYTKPFRGPGWRSQRYQPRVKFYDEREWRYVPTAQNEKPLFIGWETYQEALKESQTSQPLQSGERATNLPGRYSIFDHSL
jgi:hypothetical protein